jgi:hypothetical protein
MHVAAVSSATHECLTDLGLHAKGDIFALKAFCHRRQLTFTSKNLVDDEKNDYEDRKRNFWHNCKQEAKRKGTNLLTNILVPACLRDLLKNIRHVKYFLVGFIILKTRNGL